jgi:hypothetical protein
VKADTGRKPCASVRSPAATLVVERILGFVLSRATYAAAELRLPDLLADGPRSAAELAAASGADAPSVARLLRTLASAGLFVEAEPGTFALNEPAELLRSDVPGSLRDLALYYGGICYGAWRDPVYSIRTGKPAFEQVYGESIWEYFAQHPDAAEIFSGAMRQGAEIRVLPLLDYPWRGDETVVDLGGADGTLLLELLRRRDGLRGVVVDLPHAVAHAPKRIADAGLADRCRAVSGDLFGEVPEGGDVYLLVIVLHDWSDEKAVQILETCRRAMREDAVLLLVEIVLSQQGGPHLGKLVDLHMLIETGGRERTEDEWRELLACGGFRLARVLPSEPWSVLVALPAPG